MSTDRELLEMAAKAEGVAYRVDTLRDGSGRFRFIAHGKEWNPLTDDGDALRLAVKLNIQVTPGTYMDHKATAYSQSGTEAYEYVHSQQDMAAATRRAIVCAAAEIGRSM